MPYPDTSARQRLAEQAARPRTLLGRLLGR